MARKSKRKRVGQASELPHRLIEIGEEQTMALLRPVHMMARTLAKAQEQMRAPEGSSLRADVAIISGAAYSAFAAALVDWVRSTITPDMAQEQARRNVARVLRHGRINVKTWAEAMGRDPEADDGAARAAIAAQIQRAIDDQARLITSITEELADQIAMEVNGAIQRGERAPDLAGILTDRLGVAESRAKLIARDQATKAQGKVNKVRQQTLGVRRYEWRTAQDERVRPAHRALDGKEFSWDAPPPVGHPGEPINCRCVALPILDD